MARGIGVRVSPDRLRVSLIVADRMTGRFTDSLKGTRAIAAVFALASTHRAIQVKGSDAVIEAALQTDQALVEKTIAAFAADLLPWGLPEAAARADMTYRPNELIAISFTPDAVYEQTPDPKAGTRL